MTASAPSQDPSLQMPTGFAQPEAQPWPVADQPEATDVTQGQSVEAIEQARGTSFSAPSAADAPATSTTVSWPSYSDGVELPPAADPAVIQAADAEPLGEPDPTADPDNQEHA